MTLNAETRQEFGKRLKKIREAGKLPAVLYGHGIKNINLTLNYHDFEKVLNKISESDLIDLTIDENKPVKVLIHDIARDPVTNKFLHLDFYQVRMDEKITTQVELNFVGESPAVKELGGVLVKALDEVEIECLPGDLISKIDVELTSLKTFDDIVRVKDLSVPAKVTILTPTETTVVLVEEQKKYEEEQPVAEVKPIVEGEEEKKEETTGEQEKKVEKKEAKDTKNNQ